MLKNDLIGEQPSQNATNQCTDVSVADNNSISGGGELSEGSLLGKFKDVSSLSLAYENLQSEFTRKSQRLSQLEKALEKQNSNAAKDKITDNASNGTSNSQGYTNNTEQTTKVESQSGKKEDINDINKNINATDGQNNVLENKPEATYMSESWSNQVEGFLLQNPNAKSFATEIASELISDKDLSTLPNSLELAYAKVLAKRYKSDSDILNDEEFLEKNILNNPQITKKVIHKYLAGLKENSSPVLIKESVGSGFGVMPKDRPKSLEDAKKIVELMMKK